MVDSPGGEHKIRIIHVVQTKVADVVAAPNHSWWVHFEGSRESLSFSGEKPFEPGDKVKITFEKVE